VSAGIAEALVLAALQFAVLVTLNLLLGRPARRRGRLPTRLRIAHLLVTLSWFGYERQALSGRAGRSLSIQTPFGNSRRSAGPSKPRSSARRCSLHRV